MKLSTIARRALAATALITTFGAASAAPHHASAEAPAAATQRAVWVTFYKVHVYNDGDDFGAGEFTFHYAANYGNALHTKETSISSGSDYNFYNPQLIKFTTTGNTVRLSIMGVDDDEDPADICSSMLGNVPFVPGWGSGATACVDWNSADFVVDLPQGAGSRNVWMTTGDGPVSFKTWIHIETNG